MMTAEPEHDSSDPGAHGEAPPSEWAIPRKTSDWELTPEEQTDASLERPASERPISESPEALRNRADSLLDEMMLGGVDLSAADTGGNGYHPAASAAPNWEERSEDHSGDSSGGASSTETRNSGFDESVSDDEGYGWTDDPDTDGYSSYGRDVTDSYSHSTANSGTESYGSRDSDTTLQSRSETDSATGDSAYPSAVRANHESDDYNTGEYINDYGVDSTASPSNSPRLESLQQSSEVKQETEDATTPTPEWRVLSGGGDANQSDSTWNEYASSYRGPSVADNPVKKWQPDTKSASDLSNDRPDPSISDSYTESAGDSSDLLNEPDLTESYSSRGPDTPSDSEYIGNEGSNYSNSDYSSSDQSDPESSSESRPLDTESDSGIGYISSMAVLSSRANRSTLLPRVSRFDVDKLNREIAELHEEIRMLLPVGHAQAERAQHLLDKAHTIAASDPERSAEVEYYMQQVRTIVERTRQSRRWSDVYRSRLRTYLLAWTVLSILTLFALLVGQFEIEAAVANVTGALITSQFIVNFAGALSAIMAGALGSSIGALANMSRHARTQYGFFDRKYGLRGLMLPVIGAFGGLVIYAIFGIVYYFTGITPSLSLVAMAIPALLAFLFGLVQESLYGTNE